MTARAGVLRSADGLAAPRSTRSDELAGAAAGDGRPGRLGDHQPAHRSARSLAEAALLREETRGSHWREDFPERDDAGQSGHHDWWLRRRARRPRSGPSAPTDLTVAARPTIARTSYARPAGARCSTSCADAGLDPDAVYATVVAALDEDLPGGAVDVTSEPRSPPTGHGRRATSPPASRASSPGSASPRWSSYAMGAAVEVTDRVPDGTPVAAGDVVMRVSGPTRGLLTAERTALNFASHLSGVATATSPLGGGARRAPAPGSSTPARRCRRYRALQKYAVRCGGGINHRFSLSDMAMVKDNHVVAAGGVVPAYEAVRAAYPDAPGRGRGHRPRPAARAPRGGLRPDPARQHGHRDDGRGGPDHRRPRHPRGLRRAHPRPGPRGRRDRRRLHLGRAR